LDTSQSCFSNPTLPFFFQYPILLGFSLLLFLTLSSFFFFTLPGFFGQTPRSLYLFSSSPSFFFSSQLLLSSQTLLLSFTLATQSLFFLFLSSLLFHLGPFSKESLCFCSFPPFLPNLATNFHRAT